MQHKPNAEASRRTKVAKHPGIYFRNGADGRRRYEITYTDTDGKRRWQRVEGNLEDAQAALDDVKGRKRRGERVAPTRLTFAEYAGSWLETQTNLRARTRERYEVAIRVHLIPRLGRLRLADVDEGDVLRLIAEMRADGKAAWTVRGALTPLGRMLGAAARRGLIASNPVARLERGERPSVERREFPSLDREAIGALIAATPERYRLLVAVSVLTGLRQGEALGLRWQDVDVKVGEIRVRGQLDRHRNLVAVKTQASRRDVPIPPSLCRMLVAHRLEADPSGDTDFVFTSERGGPMHYRNVVRRGLEKATAAAGLPHLRWHDLRHLAASALIAESEGDSDHVSRVLGHSSAAITQAVYAHEFEKVKRADRMRERMEAAYGNLLETAGGDTRQPSGVVETLRPRK